MTSEEFESSLLTRHAVVSLAIDLVERRSVTPVDGGCQEVIAARLADVGFTCEPMVFGDVTNLWARIGDSSPVLCLAGHTDVVPAGNLAKWNTDPFEAVVCDDSLIGRGSADMKGSLAAMVVAAERFVRAHPDFNGSLAFLITSDEEGLAEDGTRKVVETLSARGESINWCVVGEPSSDAVLGDCVRIGRRGSLTGSLRVHGVQGHVAYPHLANNPVRLFAPVLAQLHEIEWDKGNENFPPTSFEVVHLDSGIGADNVIPYELHIRFNFRYSTEWTHESLAEKVEEILKEHGFDYELDWILSGEPFLTSEGRLTDAVVRAITETTGITPEFSTGGGTSDGRYIAPTGADVIELGPRNASIHKVNENVSLKDIVQLSEIVERTMELLLLP
jgi:succinyl-diaminopimelate desuccinylase